MNLLYKAFLLFAMNLLDALLTIVWVRNGVAAEANQLMAHLLDFGNTPFLAVKIAIGALASIVLLNWADLKIARYGLTACLAVYSGLMGLHLITGLSAFGMSDPVSSQLESFTTQIFAFLI